MTLTPRQIAAYLDLGEQLDRLDRANELAIGATAAQGDKTSIEKMLKELGG